MEPKTRARFLGNEPEKVRLQHAPEHEADGVDRVHHGHHLERTHHEEAREGAGEEEVHAHHEHEQQRAK